jgi:DNA-binding CsgD family transcriptional regulator
MLFDAFTRARRRYRGAIVAISDRTLITNASASEILQSPDRRMIWDWAQSLGNVQEWQETSFELANGINVWARCSPVTLDGLLVGVLAHLSVAAPRQPDDRIAGSVDEATPLSSVLDPALLTGWSELTDSERSVAELVGRGLSNKETGRRLFLSRHTVDYHLRRVFQKLGVSSRVELARLLGEHYDSLSGTSKAS